MANIYVAGCLESLKELRDSGRLNPEGQLGASGDSDVDAMCRVAIERLCGPRLPGDEDSFEGQFVGEGSPEWIAPLAFESNLRNAYTALDDADQVLSELRELSVSRAFCRSLESQGHEVKILFEDEEERLKARLMAALIDAFEFGKGARHGARLLFGHKEKATEGPPVFGTNELRQALRPMLLLFRKICRMELEVTVPISLKFARHGDGSYITRWCDGSRKFDQAWPGGKLEVDLRKHSPLMLPHARLRRVGVQVADLTAFRSGAEAGSSREDLVNMWTVTVSQDSGVGGDSGLNACSLDFFNVVGSRDPGMVSWVAPECIQNLCPASMWKVGLGHRSHVSGKPDVEVRDITLFFNLAYLPSGLNDA